MIPKVIHYCWFGRNPLPELATKCIESWQNFLPDYEIKEWNEDNFPLEQYIFAKEALENRKFAFVSDVARLHALKYEGGIYMDTDVEVIKSLDDLLNQTAFSGFENDDFVPTGIMASVKGSSWSTELLEYYHNKPFVNQDGTLETTSNTFIITQIMKEKGFVMNNTIQKIDGYVSFYTNDYFCPKSYKTGLIELTPNTYCIHHFAKSWIPLKHKWRNIVKMKLMNIIGYKNIQKIIDLIKK
ncbi:glycosyltransferase [uncultured Flavobacterium sp.]|uniref:glycosyltransferase family 32 protein n=1 Tax=uncultured Flavobacterium sp. TaxID=165435 RepID=UPI0030EE6BEF|tara:strand:- start:65 stop:787 length:723 start_codon:yes stop_codon:yes gene_type:complete